MSKHGLQPEQLRNLILSVGTHRGQRILSPVEVSEIFSHMQDHGASLSNCANVVHLDGTTMVSRFLRLLRLREDVRHNVDWGPTGVTISFTAASELTRLAPQDHEEVVHAVLSRQLLKKEVHDLVQRRLRSELSLSDIIEETISMRPVIENRHLLFGAIKDEDVARRISELSQAQRDIVLSATLKHLMPEIQPPEGRLGRSRFTISCDEECGQRIIGLEPDFESAINLQLRNEVLGDEIPVSN